MKKILACFKATRDLENMTSREIRAYLDGGNDLSFLREKIGAYDEAALEAALRIRDDYLKRQLQVRTVALTVGKCAERFVKELYAVGFDEIVVVEGTEEQSGDALFVAAAINDYIEEGGADIILAGQQSSPGENAKVPYILAEMQNMPCLSGVSDVAAGGDALQVLCRTDAGIYDVAVGGRALLVVRDALHPYLRVATLREKLSVKGKTESRRQPGKTLSCEQNEVTNGFVFEEGERQCIFIEGETIEQKAEVLLREYLPERIVK